MRTSKKWPCAGQTKVGLSSPTVGLSPGYIYMYVARRITCKGPQTSKPSDIRSKTQMMTDVRMLTFSTCTRMGMSGSIMTLGAYAGLPYGRLPTMED